MTTDTVESLISFCRENGRVCPQPQAWNELWNLLPAKQQKGSGWEPPLPLILAAWQHSSNLAKMMRLQEHIQWAQNHGELANISLRLRALNEEEWHHLHD